MSVWTGQPEALAGKAPDVPTVFLVRAGDLPSVREQKPAVIDRGRKHPAKALASRLLGQTRVPIVDGAFTSGGQLVRSVRTFLTLAASRGEHNAYVIGVPDTVFEDVTVKANAAEALAARPPAGDQASEPGISRSGIDEALPAAAYLTLLDDVLVPDGLTLKLVGGSPRLTLVRKLIVLASVQQEPVLILGDTGTGKEIAARAIHDLDPRRGKLTFLVINCAAIPAELFESELFGYEPGAFTGARVRGKAGLWTAVGGGTLFLDEIGDLAPKHQAKILRVLEDGAVRPVGGLKPVDVHCRVIAATNRDLYSMVQSGEFREDLYYRLRSLLIRTPRLQDHPQDIPVLARFFWERVAPGRPPLSGTVLSALAQYRWPGNARELRAVLVSLTTMFPTTAPRVEHVRAVFQL
jgi:transcriptional regulator of acetoin/glycerol metabolism